MSRPSPELARYAQRRPLWSYLVWAGVLLALYVAFFSVDLDEGSLWTFDSRVWDVSSFTDPVKFERGMERLGMFLGAFANPDASPEFIDRAWELVWQTLSTALLGTAIGVVFGYLLALGAARSVCVGEERGWRWLRWFPLRSPTALICSLCRVVLDVLRAVPDFAWAVMLVPLLGIGPMTGMIALAVSVTGILGKIYSEIWDSIDPQRYENVRAAGGSRLHTFVYGIRPLASRSMLSYTLMRAECAVRNAAVIGAVGGGGVGAEIMLRLGYDEYDRVATMVVFTLSLTLAVDLLANFIRRQLRTDPNHPRAARNQPLAVQIARKWAAAATVAALVLWSAWYQLQPHPLTVNEPQLQRLSGLFNAEGWEHMSYFEELLEPELGWTIEREGALVQTHFMGRAQDWPSREEDAARFLEGIRGKRLVLGPPGREPAHDGPRSYLEKLAGQPLDQVFSQVVISSGDKETILLIARGEADIGAIEWDSYADSRKWPETAPYRKRRNTVVDFAHTTPFYRATKIEQGSLPISLKSATIPVAMAIVGTLVGVLLAMGLAFLHSVAFQIEPHHFTGESPTWAARALRWFSVVLSRFVALVARGIPEVMWAMFFVAFFGMGVVAGAAAMAIHTLGLLARVFSETVDNIPYRRFEQSFGGSRLATFSYAAVPMSWRDWMTYSFFQFESNVRAGVVLGIIGSAGLGFIFAFNFEHFHYHKAATNLVVIIGLTVVIDRLSRLLKISRVTT
ncbi:MAG: hypothetical protein BroJett014_10000 [Planctomycetota bacterium]|nr:ABC transporter permease [Planctomycetota bacterium]GIK52027.1 MAG: hypothetical protein BroJett014_10000 [Planctomycetota bacterium]